MSNEIDFIKANIEEIRLKIARAAEKSGRRPEDITLIAVSKTVEPERINKALEAGVPNLGENKVQELLEKYDIIDRNCSWHLIGHLQTNKVKYIVDKVSLIHSVDRLDLAVEIQKRAAKAEKVVNILIQVNVSGEDTKFGVPPSGVLPLIKSIAGFANIRVKGLMTIAPFSQNPEEIRYVFKDLRKIFIDIKQENIDNIDMEILSMGMSGDYEAAIEEGSTMVRIGTAIFGKRNYMI